MKKLLTLLIMSFLFSSLLAFTSPLDDALNAKKGAGQLDLQAGGVPYCHVGLAAFDCATCGKTVMSRRLIFFDGFGSITNNQCDETFAYGEDTVFNTGSHFGAPVTWFQTDLNRNDLNSAFNTLLTPQKLLFENGNLTSPLTLGAFYNNAIYGAKNTYDKLLIKYDSTALNIPKHGGFPGNFVDYWDYQSLLRHYMDTTTTGAYTENGSQYSWRMAAGTESPFINLNVDGYGNNWYVALETDTLFTI